MPINEIQQGRFNAVLRKLFSMDVGAPSPTLATDIFPTVQLEGDRPEWAFLANQRICSSYGSVGAAAGDLTYLSLYNPAGSGVILVLEHASFYSGGGAQLITIRHGSGVPVGSLQNAATVRDSRAEGFGTLGRTVGKVYGGTSNLGLGVSTALLYLTNSGSIQEVPPIVISPGYWAAFVTYAVNLSLAATFWWRERALAPSETR